MMQGRRKRVIRMTEVKMIKETAVIKLVEANRLLVFKKISGGLAMKQVIIKVIQEDLME